MKSMTFLSFIFVIYNCAGQDNVTPYKDRPGKYYLIPANQAIKEGKASKEVLNNFRRMDGAESRLVKIIQTYKEIKKQIDKEYWSSIDVTINELNLMIEVYTGHLLMLNKDGNGMFYMNNTSIDFIANRISKYGLFLPNKEWASQEFYSSAQVTPIDWINSKNKIIQKGYWAGAYLLDDGILLPGSDFFEAILKGNYFNTYEGNIWNENRLKMTPNEKQQEAVKAKALYDAINLELKASQFKEAINDCTKYLCIIPYDLGVFSNRSVAKIGIKDYSGAIDDCNTGINCTVSQLSKMEAFDIPTISVLQILFLNRAIAKSGLNNIVGSDEDYKMSESLKSGIESINK